MVHIEHCETGRDSICADALAVTERRCVRNDDRQTTFERLFAVVVVWRGRVKSGDLVANGLDFGTVDELVPDFGCTYLRYTGIYFVLILEHNFSF